MHSRFTRTFEARGKKVSSQELEETNELLRSCYCLGPQLLLVLVRVAHFSSVLFSGESGAISVFRTYFYPLL